MAPLSERSAGDWSGMSNLDNQGFIERFTRTREHLQGLNDLDSILRFPEVFLDENQGMLPPASEYYRKQSRRTAESHPESNLPIVRIAALACDAYDNTESIEVKYIAQTIRMVNGLKNSPPSPLGGLDPIASDVLLRVRAVIYDLVSMLSFGVPIAELWDRAEAGHIDALVNLVRIDKTAITTSMGSQIVRDRHFAGDWAFFKKLGASLAKPPMSERAYRPLPVLLTARFWDEEFCHWSRAKLVKFLVDQDVLPRGQSTYDSFRKTLNKVGLKKLKGRPKKGTQP